MVRSSIFFGTINPPVHFHSRWWWWWEEDEKEGGDGKIIEDVNEVSRRLNGGPQFLKTYRLILKEQMRGAADISKVVLLHARHNLLMILNNRAAVLYSSIVECFFFFKDKTRLVQQVLINWWSSLFVLVVIIFLHLFLGRRSFPYFTVFFLISCRSSSN